MEPEHSQPSDGKRRRFRPWTWFSLWCAACAAVALAVGGTAGWVLLIVFTITAVVLAAVIARIEDPPPPPPRPPLPETGAAPLVLVVRGRTDLFAGWRLGSSVYVELVGDQTWVLPALEWYRTYAVRIPPGRYVLSLFDPRGRMAFGNTEVLDVTLIPDGRLFIEYRRNWSIRPSGTLDWQPTLPDTVVIEQVISAKREIKR